jgi:hypothetical protein
MKFLSLIGLAVTAEAFTHRELPPDPTKIALPALPKVADADDKGFPTLPAVQNIMDSASKTLSSINSQATLVQKEMMEIQQRNLARIERQRSVFDKKLKEQELKNKAELQSNSKIAKSIMTLKRSNDKLRNESLVLQQENEARRQELQALGNQVDNLNKRIMDAFAASDDSKAADLEVLDDGKKVSLLAVAATDNKDNTARVEKTQATDSKKHRKHKKKVVEQDEETEVDDGEDEVGPLSFFEISSVAEDEIEADPEPAEKSNSPAPEDIVTMLSKAVASLKEEGKKSEEQLKATFLEKFQEGVKRHTAIQEQSKVLEQTLNDMKAYEAKLKVAYKHLSTTKSNLDKAIQTTSKTLEKLSKLALVPASKTTAVIKLLQKMA